MRKLNFQPVIVIGAPRSGTNMLRDVLCSFEGVATWPCDEVNYIWRHGNVRYPSDEIPEELAEEQVRNYIRKQFDWVSHRYSAHTVVEKTCANSLRVPFVDRVVPEAKYVFIVRDGIDATGSAKLRWTAELDLRYLLEKARFVPALDLFFYGARYLGSRLFRVFSKERRVAFWGPSLDDLDKLLGTHSLDEVCALQWQRCVEKAEEAFSQIPKDRLVRVHYEAFVERPIEELSRVMYELGIPKDVIELRNAVASISSSSVGKGRAALSLSDIKRLESLVGPTLKRYGYK